MLYGLALIFLAQILLAASRIHCFVCGPSPCFDSGDCFESCVCVMRHDFDITGVCAPGRATR